MSDKAPNTALLEDKYKCDLGSLDIYDRVINLKLTTSELDKNRNVVEAHQYIIRSDYEMYYPNLMDAVSYGELDGYSKSKKCYIRKCAYKPSIKVQYKRVSMSTPVGIDIFVNNFFMFDKNGKMLRSFNNETFKLTKVEVAIGYFGQFKESMGGKDASAVTMDDLFNFDEYNLKGNGITLLTMCDTEYVQTDKLPPDMTVHIHGFVGNLFSPKLQSIAAEKGIPENYDEIISKEAVINYGSMNKNKRKTYLEETFYQSVTRRFVKEGTLPETTVTKITSSTDFISSGLMTASDAEKYGVPVYFSKEAAKYAKTYDELNRMYDASGNLVVPEATKIPTASSALAQVNKVLDLYGLEELSVTPVPTKGGLLLYKRSELTTISEMLTDTALEKLYKKDGVSLYWKDKLPAVYNINVDALCTIVCPFFFFLNPFQKFYFKSRYALGGLVSYYANFNAAEDEFYALWQTVSFATVEDVNECTIVCTGKKSEVSS